MSSYLAPQTLYRQRFSMNYKQRFKSRTDARDTAFVSFCQRSMISKQRITSVGKTYIAQALDKTTGDKPPVCNVNYTCSKRFGDRSLQKSLDK